MHKHSVKKMIYAHYYDTYNFLHSRTSLSKRIADLCRYLFPVRIVMLDACWQIKTISFENILHED
jgi:hypothetical protein